MSAVLVTETLPVVDMISPLPSVDELLLFPCIFPVIVIAPHVPLVLLNSMEEELMSNTLLAPLPNCIVTALLFPAFVLMPLITV